MKDEKFIRALFLLCFVCVLAWTLPTDAHARSIDGIYQYKETGYAGKLKMKSIGNSKIEVHINTSKLDTGHGCSFEGVCKREKNKILCREDMGDFVVSAELEIISNGIKLNDIEPFFYHCGMQGNMHGLYVR